MAKLRVYELAKELGLTNKECIDLCNALGYGVKSHSSSLDGAYADQVRRKAEREGLIRDEQPVEEKPVKKAPAKKSAAAEPTPAAGAPAAPPAPEPVAEEPAPAAEQPTPAPAEAPAAPAPAPAEAPAAPAPAPAEAPAAPAPAPEEAPAPAPGPAPAPAAEPAPAAATAPSPDGPKKVISSKPASGRPVPRPAEAPPAPVAPRPLDPNAAPRPADVPAAPRPVEAPAAAAGAETTDGPADAAPAGSETSTTDDAPRSLSGKPIPPPPGPPRSLSGKPIPPPPGLGGRGPAPTRQTGPGRGPGGPGRGPRPAGSGGPGGGPGGGFSRPAGGGGFPPPGGGPGGGPGGRPGGGRGGPQQRPPRRKGRRRRNREELQPMDIPTYTPATAPVPGGVTVIERGSPPQQLGPRLNRTAADVVRFLLQQGEMVTATQSLTDEMIELFAEEIGAEISLVNPGEEQEVELQKVLDLDDDEDVDYESLPHRPPVITVMGHVDHGKTKLLDQIRNANVVAGEAGGITQHIGAYQVERDGRKLTFIDTPGHAAFTAMRARGADSTDIVVLVVAADDGVMPQTLEAIQHARAAEVPIVVALNKIDRENADPQRVLAQLAENQLVPESWGGDTIVCEISALQNVGIDELLDNLLIVAEVEDLRARPDGRARGVVLEAELEIGRGPVATVLVQQGTLKVGDPLVAGPAWGRIRALINDHGEQIKEAPPATPVQVLGLSDVAEAGDDFVVAPDERKARSVAETRASAGGERRRGHVMRR